MRWDEDEEMGWEGTSAIIEEEPLNFAEKKKKSSLAQERVLKPEVVCSKPYMGALLLKKKKEEELKHCCCAASKTITCTSFGEFIIFI